MNKDVRVDIIYFCTPADWRFESELHGDAYDLRLLTQTASTRVEAVHALGRAVGRSEIILIIGGFYGEIYLPATVAAAIGFSCQRVGLAGATREETLVFPAGSTPFALDGRLRGASVSSGPQTIFFLDEDRAGRIRLLREAILPQILSRYALAGGAQTPPPAANAAGKPLAKSPEKADVPLQEAGTAASGSPANAADQPLAKAPERADVPAREAGTAASGSPANAADKPLAKAPERADVPAREAGTAASGSSANKADKPLAKVPERADVPAPEAEAAAVPEPLEIERVVLTPRRPASKTGRELPRIPQLEEPSAAEKQILEGLPRLHLSPEREGKADRLPEKLSFPEREPESLPRTHVELKNIRIAAAPEPKEKPASISTKERPKEARAAEIPPVEMKKMHLPTEDAPKPGDWLRAEALPDGEDAPPPEEEALAVGRVAKIVIAVIAVVLLLLALWSGYSYFASAAGEAALPSGWTAEAKEWGGTVW